MICINNWLIYAVRFLVYVKHLLNKSHCTIRTQFFFSADAASVLSADVRVDCPNQTASQQNNSNEINNDQIQL